MLAKCIKNLKSLVVFKAQLFYKSECNLPECLNETKLWCCPQFQHFMHPPDNTVSNFVCDSEPFNNRKSPITTNFAKILPTKPLTLLSLAMKIVVLGLGECRCNKADTHVSTFLFSFI